MFERKSCVCFWIPVRRLQNTKNEGASNPTSKSEATLEQVAECSKGKAVFASGSPFDDYKTPRMKVHRIQPPSLKLRWSKSRNVRKEKPCLLLDPRSTTTKHQEWRCIESNLQSEATLEQVAECSKGKAVFASGSPFDDYKTPRMKVHRIQPPSLKLRWSKSRNVRKEKPCLLLDPRSTTTKHQEWRCIESNLQVWSYAGASRGMFERKSRVCFWIPVRRLQNTKNEGASNPTSKSEATLEQVAECSKGKAVFASGSPFDDYKTPRMKVHRIQPPSLNSEATLEQVAECSKGKAVFASGSPFDDYKTPRMKVHRIQPPSLKLRWSKSRNVRKEKPCLLLDPRSTTTKHQEWRCIESNLQVWSYAGASRGMFERKSRVCFWLPVRWLQNTCSMNIYPSQLPHRNQASNRSKSLIYDPWCFLRWWFFTRYWRGSSLLTRYWRGSSLLTRYWRGSSSTLARKWDPISVPCVSFQKLQNPFSKRPIFRQTSLCKFSKLQNPFSSPKLQTPVFKGYKTFSQVGQSPIFFSVVQTTHFLKDPFL